MSAAKVLRMPQRPRSPRPLRALRALDVDALDLEREEALEQLRRWAHRLNYTTALRHPDWSAGHVHCETLRAVATVYDGCGDYRPAKLGELPTCPA